MSNSEMIARHIRQIADFPKAGVVFQDIVSLLESPTAFQATIDWFASEIDLAVTKIIGLDARGFWFAPSVALALQKPFVPIRKQGKLPGATHQVAYGLEYGEAVFELQKTSLNSADRVVIIDDVLATGGSLKAACDLVSMSGAQVHSILTLLEIEALSGRERIAAYSHKSCLRV